MNAERFDLDVCDTGDCACHDTSDGGEVNDTRDAWVDRHINRNWDKGGRPRWIGIKLSRSKARAIRNSKEPQRVTAARYGIHQSTVSAIKRGKEWIGA